MVKKIDDAAVSADEEAAADDPTTEISVSRVETIRGVTYRPGKTYQLNGDTLAKLKAAKILAE